MLAQAASPGQGAQLLEATLLCLVFTGKISAEIMLWLLEILQTFDAHHGEADAHHDQ